VIDHASDMHGAISLKRIAFPLVFEEKNIQIMVKHPELKRQ